MQSVSSRIWTRIAVFISYGDNDYTTGTSKAVCDGETQYTLGLERHESIFSTYRSELIVERTGFFNLDTATHLWEG